MTSTYDDRTNSPPRARGEWMKRHGKWLIILPPLLFLMVFFLIPFGFALSISFADTVVRVPPFTDILSVSPDWHIHLTLNLGNFKYLFTDEVYGLSYLYSLKTAFFSTLICLAIGYPMAYAIARTSKSTQSILLLIIILPFWTSFLIRIYAWMNILQHDGLLNQVLLALHLVSAPVVWLSTDSAMYLGIVYSYLPFMILPLYATLTKMEPALEEAASDLGASPRHVFWFVTFPLSLPGVGAGVLLCFIPIIGEFVIPDLLAGSNSLMIGQTLWLEFFTNKDWPVASAIAIVLLVLLLAPLLLYDRLQRRQLEVR